MIFENQQVDSSLLPNISSVELKKLSPNYKTTEYIGTSILFSFFFIGALIFFFSSSELLGYYRYSIFLIWILLFSLSMFLVGKRYQLAGYALREHDVIFKSGVWWQTITTIPFNRMQHCEISQGPIQNAFGLATLRVFTAGGSSSDLAIDGLDHEEAKRIKEFITSKISRHSHLTTEQEGEQDLTTLSEDSDIPSTPPNSAHEPI